MEDVILSVLDGSMIGEWAEEKYLLITADDSYAIKTTFKAVIIYNNAFYRFL